MFPGGSITGAPKESAIEVIKKLEHGQRELYTGSMGYLSLNGDMHLNIMIRTAVKYQDSYYLGIGGGITFESDTDGEYAETLLKGKAFTQLFNEKNNKKTDAKKVSFEDVKELV